MAYESYKDSNGITWTVLSTANGWTMIASVLDSADPKYEPPATDQMASTPAAMGPALTPLGPTPEQTRVIFTKLRDDIEAYAKAHRGAAILKVTAKNNWTVAILVMAGLALVNWGMPKRRRRRR